MLKNTDIICISSIDWDFMWQGHQEIMSEFARAGNRVLFIENTGVRSPRFSDIGRIRKRLVSWIKSTRGFRNEGENLYVYSPLVVPFPYSGLARWFNRQLLVKSLKRWLMVMEFDRPIIWTFLPTGTAMEIIKNIDRQALIYYCIADFKELTDPKKVSPCEEVLLKEADIVFAQNEFLKEKCSRFNGNVTVFPFGVNTRVFEQAKDKPVPDEIKRIKGPVVGYVGGIHRHIDFDLLRETAVSRPEWSFVFVGMLQVSQSVLKKLDLDNIFLLGKKEFNSLPGFISAFDVCIIPYSINEYTKSVYPTKLNEYHAMGKPVVSTPLPSIDDFNVLNSDIVYTASNSKEFAEKISKALVQDSSQLVELRKASAKKNNWQARIGRMSGIIESFLKDKGKPVKQDWQEKFLKFYKTSRRRLLRAVMLLALAVGVLFYTPLLWKIAAPLKISQEPEKADAIVVFAGGVGESGKAGQGYEERVLQAVELYRQGYAKNLIFSSGYKYVFKEPLLMKSLAIALGVPEKDIILEQDAVNTYENVLFVSGILSDRDWNKVLLVSSPYHILRVSLVFKKNVPGLSVIYTPIKLSNFYHHGLDEKGRRTIKQLNLSQLRAILHEYLGIVYYWFKGYL